MSRMVGGGIIGARAISRCAEVGAGVWRAGIGRLSTGRTAKMKWIVAVICAASWWAAPAAADEVLIGKIAYRDIRIESVQDGEIGFRFFARIVRKPLTQIVKVSLTHDPTLNQAEASMARGKFELAVAQYGSAMQTAKKDWHKALIAYRLGVAMAGWNVDRQVRLCAKPTKGKPGEAMLASADALAEFLSNAPTDPSGDSEAWEKLAKGKQMIAKREYEGQLAMYCGKVRRLRAKKIAWKVAFVELSPLEEKPKAGRRPGTKRPVPRASAKRPPGAARAGVTTLLRSPQGQPEYWRWGHLVTATSEEGVLVIANVLPSGAKGLDKLKPNEIIEFDGRIRSDIEPFAAVKSRQMTLYIDQAKVKTTGKFRQGPARRLPGRKRDPR